MIFLNYQKCCNPKRTTIREIGCPDLPAEVLLVSLLVLLLKTGHVVGDMKTEDVLSVDISVQLLALGVISGESLLGVRNVNTSINGSLQSSENLK